MSCLLAFALLSACGIARTPVRWDALGSGSWSGARTNDHGRQILIVFVGGKEYDSGDPCSVAYRADATEDDTEVRVRVGASSPPRRPGVFACTLKGYTRSVTARLARPLGTRKLVEAQFERVQPVFDGAKLAQPTWLPTGWRRTLEAPARGTPLDATEMYWTQSFGPPRPPPRGNHCTPTDAGVILTQGPTGSAPPGGHDDVRGAPAFYQEDGHSNRLSWHEGGQSFEVASRSGCAGDRLASKETLLRFARALKVP